MLYGWAGIPAGGGGLSVREARHAMHRVGAGGGREEKNSYLNFYCLAIKYEFYFSNPGTQKCFAHSLQKRKFIEFSSVN